MGFDLSDDEWTLLEPLMPKSKRTGVKAAWFLKAYSRLDLMARLLNGNSNVTRLRKTRAFVAMVEDCLT